MSSHLNKVVVGQSGNVLVGHCIVDTPRGEIELTERCDLTGIEAELTQIIADEEGLPHAEVGRRFGRRLKRFAKKIGRSKLLKKIAKAARKAAAFTPYGAALEQGLSMAKQARRAIRGRRGGRRSGRRGGRQGHRRAQQLTNTVDLLARRDPRARQAVRAMRMFASRGDQDAEETLGELRRTFSQRYGHSSRGAIVSGSHHPYYDAQTGMCGRGYHRSDLGHATVSGVREAASDLWNELRPHVGVGPSLFSGSYRLGQRIGSQG